MIKRDLQNKGLLENMPFVQLLDFEIPAGNAPVNFTFGEDYPQAVLISLFQIEVEENALELSQFIGYQFKISDRLVRTTGNLEDNNVVADGVVFYGNRPSMKLKVRVYGYAFKQEKQTNGW